MKTGEDILPSSSDWRRQFESFRLDLVATLRTSGRGWLGRFQRRAGAALVVGEIALGFVLVTTAALARTLRIPT